VTTTTQTNVDCATILNDAERLACWQARAYVAPAPIAQTTTEKTVSSADGTYRSVETTSTAPAIVPAPVTRTITTTEPAAPVVYSKTTTKTVTRE
jgi:hypothetical protein